MFPAGPFQGKRKGCRDEGAIRAHGQGFLHGMQHISLFGLLIVTPEKPDENKGTISCDWTHTIIPEVIYTLEDRPIAIPSLERRGSTCHSVWSNVKTVSSWGWFNYLICPRKWHLLSSSVAFNGNRFCSNNAYICSFHLKLAIFDAVSQINSK